MLEHAFLLIRQLSPEYRLRLVQHILQTLLPSPRSETPQPLLYGAFQGKKMSTLDDFRIAERRPTEEELHGT
ncbi:MAG: hypothetical protein GY801_23765 [bacterium]|nr:hypothetical protein [bacterium]